ncbi:MAG: GIY-YIG nuclease family protein [Candidatus Symbiobacter sp.]|nr:GIY-YIG nuclease family protein [Candidatus Symbiobacter sp.]
MTNAHNTVLYIGVTSDLFARVTQHKEQRTKSFTKKYNLNKLVWYEPYEAIIDAINRETFLKKRLTRQQKIELIEKLNPEWKDLYLTLNN